MPHPPPPPPPPPPPARQVEDSKYRSGAELNRQEMIKVLAGGGAAGMRVSVSGKSLAKEMRVSVSGKSLAKEMRLSVSGRATPRATPRGTGSVRGRALMELDLIPSTLHPKPQTLAGDAADGARP